MSGHAIPRTALGRCKRRHKTVMDVTEDVEMGDEKAEKTEEDGKAKEDRGPEGEDRAAQGEGREVEVDEDEAEDGEAGLRQMRKKAAPRGPTAEERREHELTHLPFRSWCRHCIMGMGQRGKLPKDETGRGRSRWGTLGLHVHGRGTRSWSVSDVGGT